MEPTEQVAEVVDPGREDATEPRPAAGAQPLIVEELLVEDVSIDGMCGVY
jgi:mycofactocin precursor